jgi:predicted phage terminase large subunit-like protein
MRVYAASDYAVTDADGDYTVHLVVGVDADDTIYVLDMWRQQAESSVWVEAALDLMERWRPDDWGEESGQILKSLGPYIQKRMEERNIYCLRTQYPSTADKATRAQSIRARMSMGKVKFPRNADWLEDFIYEVTRFPAGVFDDQVDALSLIGRMMVTMTPARSARGDYPAEQAPISTWGDVWKRQRKAKKWGQTTGGVPVIGQSS